MAAVSAGLPMTQASTTVPAGPRVAVFSLSPTPHFVPLLRTWTAHGAEVGSLFLTETCPNRRWQPSKLDFGTTTLLSSGKSPGTLRSITAAFLSALRSGQRAEVWVLSGSYAEPAFLGVWIAVRLSRAPFVMWGERPQRRHGWRRFARDQWIRVLLRRADEIWTPSAPGAEYYRRLSPAPTRLLPYPLDWPRSSPKSIAAKWRSTAPVQIVVVGALVPRKRPEMALDVIRTFRDSGADVRARFLGDGPLRAELIASASDLPVEFCGHKDVDAVRDAMESAHVLLHTSREDGWGMVVAEAVACGTAVVGSMWTDSVVELSDRLLTVVKCADDVTEYVTAIESIVAACQVDGGKRVVVAAQTVHEACGSEVLGVRSLDSLKRLAHGV